MTETARSSNGRPDAKRSGRGKNAGLTINRVFTTEGTRAQS